MKGSSMKRLLLTTLILCGLMVVVPHEATAQTRLVILPFRNTDGLIDYNLWQYELADSLRTMLVEMDPNEQYYHIVDPDSVEMAIAEFNLDPTNAQYESDVWRAVELVQADKVIQGNFFLQGERVLINAYIYTVEYKMADQQHLAKDIVRSPTTYLSAVKLIAKKLFPGLQQ